MTFRSGQYGAYIEIYMVPIDQYVPSFPDPAQIQQQAMQMMGQVQNQAQMQMQMMQM